MDTLINLGASAGTLLRDLLPLMIILIVFQVFILRRPISNPKRTALGFFYVFIGLAMFLVGLEEALFPIGKLMATQLTDPAFIYGDAGMTGGVLDWKDYTGVYIFAAAIGFTATIAEPALIAVALKARSVSGGAINAQGLRFAVALGVALGVTLGTFRIVTGTPLHYYIIAGYIIVILQTTLAPRMIIGLAYDSGGVTTSTVTVPLLTALGLGLANTIPGRSALIDGFGLIAFASLFPMITVMGYAQIVQWRSRRKASDSDQSD